MGLYFGNNQPIRMHGLASPLNGWQILSWIYILFTAIIFYGVIARNFDILWQPTIYGLITGLLALIVFNYLLTTFINPVASWAPLDSNVGDVPLVDKWKTSSEVLYCQDCDMHVTRSVEHCQNCNKCIAGYGFHSNVFNTCIGEKNFRPFSCCLLSCIMYNLSIVLMSEYLLFAYFYDWTVLEPYVDYMWNKVNLGGSLPGWFKVFGFYVPDYIWLLLVIFSILLPLAVLIYQIFFFIKFKIYYKSKVIPRSFPDDKSYVSGSKKSSEKKLQMVQKLKSLFPNTRKKKDDEERILTDDIQEKSIMWPHSSNSELLAFLQDKTPYDHLHYNLRRKPDHSLIVSQSIEKENYSSQDPKKKSSHHSSSLNYKNSENKDIPDHTTSEEKYYLPRAPISKPYFKSATQFSSHNSKIVKKTEISNYLNKKSTEPTSSESKSSEEYSPSSDITSKPSLKSSNQASSQKLLADSFTSSIHSIFPQTPVYDLYLPSKLSPTSVTSDTLRKNKSEEYHSPIKTYSINKGHSIASIGTLEFHQQQSEPTSPIIINLKESTINKDESFHDPESQIFIPKIIQFQLRPSSKQ